MDASNRKNVKIRIEALSPEQLGMITHRLIVTEEKRIKESMESVR
jgi:hypothetical protein